MNQKGRSIQYYIDKLDNDKPFTLARYGDGEWRTILGGKYRDGHNSNGCTFTKSLGIALGKAVRDQFTYDYGILRVARRNHRAEIERWLKRNHVITSWVDGDVILNSILSGTAFPLFEQLRKKKVLLVCPDHCLKFSTLGFFSPVAYVVPPPRDAYDHRKSVLSEVEYAIGKFNIDVIGWSSGLAAKHFIHEVYKVYGNVISQIDFGSAWDGFFGVGSRSYVRRGKVLWDDLIEVNSGKRERKDGETFRKK